MVDIEFTDPNSVEIIVWLIFNSVWFNPRWNFLIVSLLMWSILAGIYITLWHVVDFWMIFILGIPGQVIILLWSLLRYSDEEDDDQSASAGTKRRRQGKDAGEGGEDGPQDDER